MPVLLGFMVCSSSEEGAEADWAPGPPQRPLFFGFEGLKWGMTPADIKVKLAGLDQIQGDASLQQIIEQIGPPNLYLEESPGNGKLYYFWLTGTNLFFNITEGRKDGHRHTFYEEDLR
jgi:hypothetical protein